MNIKTISLIHKILFVALITAIQFLISYLKLGVYWAWIDDIISGLLMSGGVINEPKSFYNLVIHNHTGSLYQYLYTFRLNINWFGLFIYSFAYVAILIINFILFYIVSPNKISQYLLFVLLSTCFFMAFLVESIMLLNYSKIALLLSFSAFLGIYILYRFKPSLLYKKILFFVLIVSFYLGLSTRPGLIIAFLPIAFLYILFNTPIKQTLKIYAGVIGFLMLYSAFSWIILSKENKTIVREMYPSETYIISLLDGYNLSHQYENERDSIKIACLKSWYIADQDTLLNQEFLNEIGGKSSFKQVTFNNWKESLRTEYKKAKSNYSENYLPELNWWWKTVVFLLLIFLIPLLFYFTKHFAFRQLIGFYLYLIGSITFILLITILLKMEDRVLNPLLIFILLTVLLSIQNLKRTSKRIWLIAFIVCFGTIGLIRMSDYNQIHTQRANELLMKEKIRNELKNNFIGKYIVFDLYSITMLETSPFKFVEYPKNWISGVEVWNYSTLNESYMNKVVNTIDFPIQFIEIAKNKHRFVFFYKSERIELTKDYNSIIYGIDIYFKKVSENLLIDDFHYSLHWIPFDYGYYELENVSKSTD